MSVNTASLPTQVVTRIQEILFDLSGFEVDESSASTSFLELGFDSLFLIQFSTSLKRELGVEVSFRQMLEDTSTFASLSGYVSEHLPADAFPDNEVSSTNSIVANGDTAPDLDETYDAQDYDAGDVNGMADYVQTDDEIDYLEDEEYGLEDEYDIPVRRRTTLGGESSSSSIESILDKQLEIMAQQLAAISGDRNRRKSSAKPQARKKSVPKKNSAQKPVRQQNGVAAQQSSNNAAMGGGSTAETKRNGTAERVNDRQPQNGSAAQSSGEMKPFGAIARIQTKTGDELLPQQQTWLNDFVVRYNEMTAKSKEFTAKYHSVHADPRVVSGFKSKTKELIYPIVATRTNGCRIWDLDGNEYVDALNGFGSNFFGYANPDITQAVVDQMWRGVEIGPQCPLTGEAAELICEFTGMDRVGFCNTGSEAVMGAMRIARTITGRSLIVIFSGSYHGIFDEVIVRSTPQQRSIPAAPGIMPSAVENVLVLEYGTEESLEIIRGRIDEFAAVMVEPVQSRKPEFQPREFLHELRKITAENDVPFIFDEVITGFRTGPRGAQEFFDIEADIATYGKVVGGGMHIGVVAGKAKYMDALDGGPWHYGDDSVPEVGVTYFAGTFVRHPASIAACLAAMRILKEAGPALQKRVNAQTTYLVSELNNFFRDSNVPLEVNYFSSLWRMTYTENVPYGELLFYLIRENGVHIYDGFPCFITMAHTDEDVELILNAVKESVLTLQSAGFLPLPAGEVAKTDFFVPAS